MKLYGLECCAITGTSDYGTISSGRTVSHQLFDYIAVILNGIFVT
jgi:hypothetical protein